MPLLCHHLPEILCQSTFFCLAVGFLWIFFQLLHFSPIPPSNVCLCFLPSAPPQSFPSLILVVFCQFIIVKTDPTASLRAGRPPHSGIFQPAALDRALERPLSSCLLLVEAASCAKCVLVVPEREKKPSERCHRNEKQVISKGVKQRRQQWVMCHTAGHWVTPRRLEGGRFWVNGAASNHRVESRRAGVWLWLVAEYGLLILLTIVFHNCTEMLVLHFKNF